MSNKNIKANRILVIEDDPALRATIRDILEAEGYGVKETDNGKIGLSWQQASPFDLIITDILMPEIDGLEIVMEIKDKYPETRMLAISGGGYISSDKYLYMAEELGSHKILSKPFENDELIKKVDQLLSVCP